MEFDLTEEQRMLQSSVARYLEGASDLDTVRAAAEAGAARADTVWDGVTELGVHGVIIPETYGGVGLSLLDAALIAESLGSVTAVVPFTGSSIMAPTALLAAGSDDQKEDWLPRIATGESVVGVGLSAHTGRRETAGVVAEAGTLTGKAMFVLDGAAADAHLIAADDGSLHLVDAADVESRTLNTIDRTRCIAEVTLDGAPADVLPGSVGNREPLLKAIDVGRIMLAADTLGAAQVMLDKAVAYAQERRQFNRVIGSFQAVKHLCAEMAADLEPCRSLVWYAAHVYEAIPEDGRLTACHTKAQLGDVGQSVARKSTEVHGGMGITDLLGLHYWFKRIGFNRLMLGSPETVREEAARVQGWI